MSDRQYLLTKKQITDLWQWAVTDRLISSGVAATLERDLEGLLRHAGAEPLTAERDALRAEVELYRDLHRAAKELHKSVWNKGVHAALAALDAAGVGAEEVDGECGPQQELAD